MLANLCLRTPHFCLRDDVLFLQPPFARGEQSSPLAPQPAMVSAAQVATYEALRAVLQHEEPAYIETLKRDVERARMEAEDIRAAALRGAQRGALTNVADPLDEMETTAGESEEEEDGLHCVLCSSTDGTNRFFFNMEPEGRWVGLPEGARIVCSVCFRQDMGRIESFF